MSEVAIRNLCKKWGAFTAVDGISFEATQGELTVLLGPSGCGKSTTLRLIAGLESASEGSILIDGRDVTETPPAGRALSMVFQSYALFPHLNVAENILFGLKVRKISKQEQSERLHRVAGLLGLSELLDRRPSQLSGGQQQRVALGRAIIAQRNVCLMDEPLSNLDAKLRHEMRVEIRDLQQKLGFTLVYVTHDQGEAMSMADRVVLLRDGRIEQNAPPEIIYQKPASAFVARFIGTPPMNIMRFDGPVSEAVVNVLGHGQFDPLTGKGLRFGIRPEDIRLTDKTGIAAQVAGLDYLGADTLVDCMLGDEKITVRTLGRTKLKTGDEVHLNWDCESVHFFDGPSGKRREDLIF